MENSIRKGYERLSTNVLRGFNDEWVQAIVSCANESEFDKLRQYFHSEEYEIFCGLCGINAKDWQQFLEKLKSKACTNKKLYAQLKARWYERKHLENEEDLV